MCKINTKTDKMFSHFDLRTFSTSIIRLARETSSAKHTHTFAFDNC